MAGVPTIEELQKRIALLEEQARKHQELNEELKSRAATERALLNAQTQSAVLFDLDGKILAINNVAARRLGREPDELIGLRMSEFLSPELAASRESLGRRVVESGQAVRFQDERDGRTFNNHVLPVFGEAGEAVALAVYAEDITDSAFAEQQLRESESQLRDLIEKVQVGIVVHAADTKIIHCNTTAQNLLGLSGENMLGKKATDSRWQFLRSDGAEMPVHEYPVNAVLTTGTPLSDLVVGVCRPETDDIVWVLANAVPRFDEGGVLTQIIVTFNDITDRRRAEEALFESEARFRGLVEASFDGVALSENGAVVEANEAFAAMFDLDPLEVVGITPADVLTPESTERAIRNYKAGCSEPYEVTVVLKDGSERLVETVGRNVTWHGRPARITGFRDITARREAEEAVRQSEQKFRTLANVSPMAISILRDDRYLYVNEAWEKLTGYSKEEAETLNPLAVVHSDMREQVQERASDRVSGKQVPSRYEMKGITKSGDVIWLDFSAVVIPYDDEPAILSIVVDITDRKAAEEERERLIEQLQEALTEVKTLRGILPMCSYCKKIRDDKGFWERVEDYLAGHSDAAVSHALCPECAAREYPGVFDRTDHKREDA